MKYRPHGWKEAKSQVIGKVTEGCYECADQLVENAVDACLLLMLNDKNKLTQRQIRNGAFCYIPKSIRKRTCK